LRAKGKIISWNEDKAFGFIAPFSGGENIFIHKNGLANRKRTPQRQDVITYTNSKDKQGRYCAIDATFTGEKLKKKQANSISKFSLYLAFLFLIAIAMIATQGMAPIILFYLYGGMSFITFIVYTIDKEKAQKGGWRTSERTLHFLALIGGWPGAAFAQQLLRHKSQKSSFRFNFWLTVIINIAVITWLLSTNNESLFNIFL